MALLPGFPAPISELIQTNKLSAKLSDGLRPNSSYGREAEPDPLAPHTGQDITFMRLGMFDVDMLPAAPSGNVDAATFNVEQFKASPIPYAKKFEIDAITAFTQMGNYTEQGVSRLAEWAGRTRNRVARGKLFNYAGGRAMVRRAQTTSDAVLLVNTAMGFGYTYPGGIPTPVSGANPLTVTIVAATTFTAQVTGVKPLNPKFPAGPAELVLSGNLSAAVAAGSYVTASNAPKVLRSGGRASSDALLTTDIPTVADLLAMRATMIGRGVQAHPSTGTHHLHVDETFMPAIIQDVAFQRYFTGAEMIPILDTKAYFVPNLGITIFENNDSPAYGKGHEVNVGASGSSGTGGTGAPGSSVSMQDIGLDVINYAGVPIRRAIMTGEDVTRRVFIDQDELYRIFGVLPVGRITDNVIQYQLAGGPPVYMADVVDFRLVMRPPLDDRGLKATFTIQAWEDFTLTTDQFAASASSDATPLKRAVVLEYGQAA